jgi:3'-5' exoribonuclease
VKPAYIADLQPDQTVTSLFLVRSREVRTSGKSGASWLQLELVDRTGSIEAKMWDNFSDVAATFDRDDIVKVRARVKVYRGRQELTVEQIARAGEGGYDLEDFLPHTKQDVAQLYAQLREAVNAVADPWLKKLLVSVVEDPAIAPKLKRAPAAMTMHHAYLGGLLEHIVSLCGLVCAARAHYPEVNGDLLIAAAVLHDIGKIDELAYERAFSYTTEGELLGHIVIALALVRRKIEALPGFPVPLVAVLEHLIISHHGSYEFGSPRLPMFPEAVLFHYLDDLDSKMGAMRASLGSERGEREWTERNPSLRRTLLRVEDYLHPASEAAAAPNGTLFGEPNPRTPKR